ncbi:MAG TPA: HAMP domain-containing sensor histidine kinase [Pyrinomonadaceae bacterium]
MRGPRFVLLVAAALAVLLALLATLQYRWLGQVSAGERERMQTTLRAATARFTQDFDRELGRVYFSFQLDEQAGRALDAAEFAARYRRWQETAPAPRLVRAVYLVERAPTGGANEAQQLYRFDPAAQTLAPAQWPAELAPLQARFARKYVVVTAGRTPEQFTPEQLAPVPPLAGDVPAVVIPVTTTQPLHLPADDQPVMLKTWLAPASHVVVVLDLDYIRAELLPTLARRYFATGGATLDYNLTVTTRTEPPRVVYQSDPHANAAAPGDASAGLFNVRFDEMDVFMPAGMPPVAADAQPKVSGTQPAETKATDERPSITSIRVFQRTQRRPAPGATMHVRLNGEDEGDWQLAVAHPAGSLDAAVTRARRRSLAVSFGVLLLLAASVALLVGSTHRAQALARQQMEFVAGVTHELRTPLAVICSAGENLADGVIFDRQQVRRYGQVIRGEGRRLAEMVEQVLEFAGAQRARRKFEPRPLAVAHFVAATLAAWQAAQDTTPHVEQDTATSLPPVLADEPALRRALQNLLSNALKYGGAEPWLRVSTRATETPRWREVQITVEDRGLGIEPAELPHIFEPFYRGREVRAAQIHGNGLGLSLVKDIVEAHGGRVTVRSTRGRGSAFTIHLPALAAAAPTDDAAPNDDARRRTPAESPIEEHARV